MPRLLLLTDRSQLRLGRCLTRTVAECVDAGLTHVVLRELDESPAQRASLAAAMTETGAQVIAARTPLPGCVGVHLPSDGGSPSRHGGAMTLVGRSCHTRAEVERAAAEGVDYVTLGPYAATPSKPGYEPVLGPDDYAGLPVPVFALGGVTPANAAAARAAGCHGVAVMGGVMRAHDPAAVVAALLREVA